MLRAKCIEAEPGILSVGIIYNVVQSPNARDCWQVTDDRGVRTGWYKTRFELLPETQEKKMETTDTQEIGDASGRACPKCQAITVWRKGRYGMFHGCSNYKSDGTGCYGKIGAPRGKYAKKEEKDGAPLGSPEDTEMEDSVFEEMNKENTMKTPEIDASKVKPTSEFGKAIWNEIGGTISQQVNQLVAKARIDGVTVTYKKGEEVIAKVEGYTHSAIHECLDRVNAGLKNILLVGPAGSGKTQLAADLAKALSYQFTSVSCTAGMPEWHIVGRATPNLATGANVYAKSDFVDRYENGGIALLDELDAADPNTLLVMNSSLSNGHLSLPARSEGPRAARHETFIFVGAANTYGQGASRQYVGRNQLDASTLSRFACSIIEVDYDRKLEESLTGDKAICERVWKIRDNVERLGLRRVVGTRELLNVFKLVKSGKTIEQAIKALTVGWTPDEKSKAL